MNFLRKIIHTLWRMTPTALHWRLLWLTHARFNVGVSGLVTNSAGEVLLLRHVVRRQYAWGLPSGWINKRETVQDALAREVREEIRLQVQPGEVISVRSGYALRVEIVIEGTLESVDGARYGLEVSEARFFRTDALPEGLLPAHRELIERFAVNNHGELRRFHVH